MPASPRTPCASRAWTCGRDRDDRHRGRRHPGCRHDHRGRRGNRRRRRDDRRSRRPHRGRRHRDAHRLHRDARHHGWDAHRDAPRPSGRASCPGSDVRHRDEDRPHRRHRGRRHRRDGCPDGSADAASPGWGRTGCCRGAPRSRGSGPCPGSGRTGCCPDAGCSGAVHPGGEQPGRPHPHGRPEPAVRRAGQRPERTAQPAPRRRREPGWPGPEPGGRRGRGPARGRRARRRCAGRRCSRCRGGRGRRGRRGLGNGLRRTSQQPERAWWPGPSSPRPGASALGASVGNFSLYLRTTGVSIVELALLTYSPMPFRRSRRTLLVTPSSLASALTRTLDTFLLSRSVLCCADRRYSWGVLIAEYSSGAHQRQTRFRFLLSDGGSCSCSLTQSATAVWSGGVLQRSARPNARRRTARSRHETTGCSEAPRPGRRRSGSGRTTGMPSAPGPRTTRRSADRLSDPRHPMQVRNGSPGRSPVRSVPTSLPPRGAGARHRCGRAPLRRPRCRAGCRSASR